MQISNICTPLNHRQCRKRHKRCLALPAKNVKRALRSLLPGRRPASNRATSDAGTRIGHDRVVTEHECNLHAHK